MNYVEKASVYLNQNGMTIPFEEGQRLVESDKHHCIDWYLDPFCPFCVRLDLREKDELLGLLNETNSIIRFHFVTFLNERTSNRYSEKASAYMLAVGSVRQDLFLNYMHGIMNQEFHPSIKVHRTDKDFEELFYQLEGTKQQWEEIESMKDKFIQQANVLTNVFFSDEKLAKKSPLDGETFVPFVFVDDGNIAFNVHEIDTFEAFLKGQIN